MGLLPFLLQKNPHIIPKKFKSLRDIFKERFFMSFRSSSPLSRQRASSFDSVHSMEEEEVETFPSSSSLPKSIERATESVLKKNENIREQSIYPQTSSSLPEKKIQPISVQSTGFVKEPVTFTQNYEQYADTLQKLEAAIQVINKKISSRATEETKKQIIQEYSALQAQVEFFLKQVEKDLKELDEGVTTIYSNCTQLGMVVPPPVRQQQNLLTGIFQLKTAIHEYNRYLTMCETSADGVDESVTVAVHRNLVEAKGAGRECMSRLKEAIQHIKKLVSIVDDKKNALRESFREDKVHLLKEPEDENEGWEDEFDLPPPAYVPSSQSVNEVLQETFSKLSFLFSSQLNTFFSSRR